MDQWTFVDCPMCRARVAHQFLNSHIDIAHPEALPAEPIPKRCRTSFASSSTNTTPLASIAVDSSAPGNILEGVTVTKNGGDESQPSKQQSKRSAQSVLDITTERGPYSWSDADDISMVEPHAPLFRLVAASGCVWQRQDLAALPCVANTAAAAAAAAAAATSTGPSAAETLAVTVAIMQDAEPGAEAADGTPAEALEAAPSDAVLMLNTSHSYPHGSACCSTRLQATLPLAPAEPGNDAVGAFARTQAMAITSLAPVAPVSGLAVVALATQIITNNVSAIPSSVLQAAPLAEVEEAVGPLAAASFGASATTQRTAAATTPNSEEYSPGSHRSAHCTGESSSCGITPLQAAGFSLPCEQFLQSLSAERTAPIDPLTSILMLAAPALTEPGNDAMASTSISALPAPSMAVVVAFGTQILSNDALENPSTGFQVTADGQSFPKSAKEAPLEEDLLDSRARALDHCKAICVSSHAKVLQISTDLQEAVEQHRQAFEENQATEKPTDPIQLRAWSASRVKLGEVWRASTCLLKSWTSASREPAETLSMALATLLEKVSSAKHMLEIEVDTIKMFEDCKEKERAECKAREVSARSFAPSLVVLDGFARRLAREVDGETSILMQECTDKLMELRRKFARCVFEANLPKEDPIVAHLSREIASTERLLDEQTGRSALYRQLLKDWQEVLKKMPPQNDPTDADVCAETAPTPLRNRTVWNRLFGRS